MRNVFSTTTLGCCQAFKCYLSFKFLLASLALWAILAILTILAISVNRKMCFLDLLWDFDKLSNAIFLSNIGWLFWLFLAILAILSILAISVNQNAKCVF